MKKSFLLIVSIIYSLLFVGCQNNLFQTVTSRFSTQKPEEMTPSQVETFNTAQIDKDLQSVYARNWKEEFSEGQTRNAIQQVAFEQPAYLPRNPNSHLTVSELLNRAEGAKRGGNISKAASFYHAILKKNQRHPVAHHQLAVLADKQRDFRTSEFHYRAALREKSNNPDLYSDLGYSYLTQNRLQEAEGYLRQALRLRPSHQLALNNLGILYGRTGDRDRALEMFRRTGTEQEAQQKLASITPQNNFQPQDNIETRNVSYPKTPPAIQPKPIQQVESVTELRKRMEEIRHKAITERNRKKTNGFSRQSPPQQQQRQIPPVRLDNVRRTIPVIRDEFPHFPPQQKQYPQQTQQYRQSYSHDIDPRLLQQIRTRRLPDRRLNEAFRAIEQGDKNRTERYQPSPRITPRRTPRQREHRLLAPRERERRDTNPLNSMEEWNPSVGHVEPKQQPHQQASHNTASSHHTVSPRSSYLPQKYYQKKETSFSKRQLLSMHKDSSISQNKQQTTQQQAARLGMSEGLNGMLPTVGNQYKKPVSIAHRSLPGSNSRMGGVDFIPSQSYVGSRQRNGIQQSRFQQIKEDDIDAKQRDSALYWKDPRKMESSQKNLTDGHHQKYLMQQNERRQYQRSQDIPTMNREYNKYSQHLSRQPIPQGNGTYSPRLGQYYGPDQYRKTTSNFSGSTTSWK